MEPIPEFDPEESIGTMTLIEADDAFTKTPNNETAGALLRTAMEYEADEAISTEELLDYVAVIKRYLLGEAE